MAPSAGVETHTEPAGPDPGLLGFCGAGSGNGAIPVCGPCAIVTDTAAQLACGVPEPVLVPPLLPLELEPLPPEDELPGLVVVAGVDGLLLAGVVAVICERPPQALAATMRQLVASTSSRFRLPIREGASRETAGMPT